MLAVNKGATQSTTGNKLDIGKLNLSYLNDTTTGSEYYVQTSKSPRKELALTLPTQLQYDGNKKFNVDPNTWHGQSADYQHQSGNLHNKDTRYSLDGAIEFIGPHAPQVSQSSVVIPFSLCYQSNLL